MTSPFKIAIIGAGSVGFTKTLDLRPAEGARIHRGRVRADRHQPAQSRHDPRDHRRDRQGQQSAGQGHRDHRPARGHQRRALHHELRAGRRARGLCHRREHPAQIRRRPVRRRHHLRRRHSLWPAQHPGDPRFLQGYPRGGGAGGAVPQLCQPDGDEHLGGARIWRRQHRRALPRRAARGAPDRAGAGGRGQRARLCLLGHQPPDLVHRHQGQGARDRQGRAARGVRAAPGLFEAGKGAHRRAEAVRGLFDESRTGISASTCRGTASGRKRSRAGST